MSAFDARQASLLASAQTLFIVNQLTNFPLYYLPIFRSFGGDAEPKFPCSISWMTRKGLPRYSTLLLWLVGWSLLLRAFFKDGEFGAMSHNDWYRAAFMLQMFAAGFVTVVCTPMKGKDVAMGSTDALHCYAAMLYVFDHVVANEIMGVPLTSPFGLAFAVTSFLCGTCQSLRASDDLVAKRLHARIFRGSTRLSLPSFLHLLEIGFMVNENALFLIFLLGMTSGLDR